MSSLYITHPQDLVDHFWKDRQVRIIEKKGELARDRFTTYDISLESKAKDEDLAFAECQDYRANLRRGNTIISIQQKDKKSLYVWGRKGTPKMFDISLNYLLKHKQSKDQQSLSRVTFDPVLKAFKRGNRVQVIRTQKVNGENAQVSYCYELDAWVICSKNVSLLAANVKDLEGYKEDRYAYAREIAVEWFKVLGQLKKEHIPELKKTLDGFTIIGEYCGNPKFQHLIKYKTIGILWFAMVKNNSSQFCIDPFEVKQKLKLFGFDFVKIKSVAICNNQTSFKECLLDIYRRTAKSSINDRQYGQQGCITYFIEHYKSKGEIQLIVIGGGKLKTLEYRLLRKIREKLSTFNSRSGPSTKEAVIEKYVKECKELAESFQTSAPYPLSYYLGILSNGLDYVDKYGINDRVLRGNFITFLDCLLYTAHKKIDLTRKLFENQEFCGKIRDIEWTEYEGNGCNSFIIYVPIGLQGMGKSQLSKKLDPEFARLGFKFKVISEDKIKKQIQNDSDETEDAWDEMFHNQLITIIKSSFEGDYKKNRCFLYLDRNNNGEQIERTLKLLNRQVDNRYTYKVIFVIPKAQQTFDADGDHYPFGLQTILACLASNTQGINADLSRTRIAQLGRQIRQFRNFQLRDFQHSYTRQFQFPYTVTKTLNNKPKVSKALQGLIKASKHSLCNDKRILDDVLTDVQKNFEFEWTGEQASANQVEELVSVGFPKIPMLHVGLV